MARFAVIGDIHGAWAPIDNAQLDAEGYDAVLVVGDLAGLRQRGALAVLRALAQLRTPALWVPGNHDASHPVQLLGEAVGQPGIGAPFVGVQARNLDALREAFAPHTTGAYSLHRLAGVAVVVGRPHSMGGPTLSFARHLHAGFDVADLDASASRLRALFDAVDAEEDVVVLAHNGPAGLGAGRADLWGCDFRAEQGDWGDPDLADALAHARGTGKRVRAVVAGHMHRRLRGGGERVDQRRVDGTLYVNAAVVPRVVAGRGRHHVELIVDAQGARARDRWLPEAG